MRGRRSLLRCMWAKYGSSATVNGCRRPIRRRRRNRNNPRAAKGGSRKLMGDTQLNGGERRALERQASSQLTTLTSVLAGFGFAWFAILVDKEHPSPFTVVIVVVSALTIFLLVVA